MRGRAATIALSLICCLPGKAHPQIQTTGNCSPAAVVMWRAVTICNVETDEQKARFQRLTSLIETLIARDLDGGAEAVAIWRAMLLRIADMNGKFSQKLERLEDEIERRSAQADRVEAMLKDLPRRVVEEMGTTASPSTRLVRRFAAGPLKIDPAIDVARVNHLLQPSVERLLADSGCHRVTLPRGAYPYRTLLALIATSDSMNCTEKQEWFDLYPSMTDPQKSRLFDILEKERLALRDLENKYRNDLRCIDVTSDDRWAQIRRLAAVPVDARHLVVTPFAVAVADACRATSRSGDKKTLSARRKRPDDAYAISMRLLRAVLASAHGQAARERTPFAFALVFMLDEFRDAAKADRLLDLAFARQGDEWDVVVAYLEAKAKARRWTDAYAGVGRVLEQNRIPELRDLSEASIHRRTFLYWSYVYYAAQAHAADADPQVAVDGYNITRLAFERDPTPAALRKLVSFAGFIARTLPATRSDMAVRLQSLERSAEAMQSAGRLSGGQLREILLALSWYGLFAQDYELAARSARAALDSDPAFTLADGNLAHNLILNGRLEDGLAIYRKHKGEMVADRPWRDLLHEDFDALAEAKVGSVDWMQVLTAAGL